MNIPSLFKQLIKIIRQSSADSELQQTLLSSISEKIKDYNQQLNRLEELEKNFVTLETLLDTTKEAVFSFKPGGPFDRMNFAAVKLLQLENVAIESITAEDTLPALLVLLDNPNAFLVELDKIANDKTLAIEGLCKFKDGREFEYYSLPKMRHDEYLGRIWCWRDITEIRRKDALIEHQAYHDSLTDLPNKTLMMANLEHAVSAARRHSSSVAVLFIDLDDFKKINDTAGHKQGDSFLIAVSKRIKGFVRESDYFGRIGGDEFLIIIEKADSFAAKETYKRIIEGFKLPLDVGDYRYYVSCSIGISLYPKDSSDPMTLIRQADMAMYQAKRQGKNTYCYYHPRLARSAINALNTENAIRKGLKDNQFQIKYQPEVDIKTQQIVGAEALIRWELADGSIRTPDEFIPIAEKSGLINELTYVVVKKACKTIRQLAKTHLNNMPVSINLSAKDLQSPTFSADIIEILKKANVSGKNIIFEITESIFLDGMSQISQVVNDLKTYGIRFAIDDFGTGYSSFRYLQLIDIDFIKIDKSFIHLVDQNTQQSAITKSIIDIGINLKVELIAEGVQTQQELEFIKQSQCRIVQGYLISPPLDANELKHFYWPKE